MVLIEILNMEGGRFYGTTESIVGNKIPLRQSYVEKTPNKFKFFLDVDIKEKEFRESMIDEWLPKEEAWIAKCSKNKGYHIIFENLICNSKEEAIKIFNKLKNINNVLDKQVYYTGLRMIHAPKKEEQRFYEPYKVRRDKKYEDLDKTKWYKEFFITMEDNMINFSIKRPKGRTTNLPYNIYKKVEKKAKTYFYSKNRNCGNLIKGEHRSNFIYYELVKGKKLVQRCWCSCNTTENRRNGLCKDYKSEPFNIGVKEYETLINLKI
jgi:hypothetical protein